MLKVRGLADKVGFAHTAKQMDAVIQRISAPPHEGPPWRFVISPHDDYAYAGSLYPPVLAGIKAKTVVIFGVAHRARTLKLENQLVFDSFTHWHGPYRNVAVSSLREDLIAELAPDSYVVHDEMQTVEHSVEAKLPFLQHYNRDVEIVSILVPAMPYSRMKELALPLSHALAKSMHARKWVWGKDVAIVVSTDAVHYGDEGWGGRNFARYGTDEAGTRQAMDYDRGIVAECLVGEPVPRRSELFTRHTVREDDYREYKWTWCGRYSVPFAMLTAWNLQQELKAPPLQGQSMGYGTSIDAPRIRVEDLPPMGVTAPANTRHWVGYSAVGYR